MYFKVGLRTYISEIEIKYECLIYLLSFFIMSVSDPVANNLIASVSQHLLCVFC